MKYCMNCGAELGAGRFCTNCGTPVGSATPPVDADALSVAPAVVGVGPAAAATAPEAPASPGRPTPAYAASPAAAPASDRPHWTGWVLLTVGVVLAVILGSCLAHGGDDARHASASATTSASTTTSSSTTGASTPLPSDSGRAGTDLARGATVDAPAPIRPGTDLAGHRVPYPATNMLDGTRDSAYRLAGDATGTVIRFTFSGERTVTAVGLVNGYAKTDGGVDWYPLNRRIEQVQWRFADGTTIQQDLVDTDDLQTMQVAPEKTGWVELTLLKVSKPGDGRGGKDTTAISDVLLLGS
ncbi:zinc ribbon domain-containing protein [Nocardioides jiangxiensis]|uniref:Zinc ribbon domain-containing protein n=1 Tax=Nocardioides jiangxiensis TaxID=3064524 RepID=A0ABT9B3N1_9ACTN|nr:zinc ribbon domain-containing protein [Nocardioides sp. WY-20]MDO7869318.1 zinc ribbon domain-containing protein [Nocardioides sp. WY-20]